MEIVSQNVKVISKKDFNSICRLCLVQSPMACIFNLKYEETLFYKILSELFSSQVKNEEDEMPRNICATCISETIRFHNFKKLFLASDKILKSIITEELNKTSHNPILHEDVKLEDFANTVTTSDNDLTQDSVDIAENSYESYDQKFRPEGQMSSLASSGEDEIKIEGFTTDNFDIINDFSIHLEDNREPQEAAINDFEAKHVGNGTEKEPSPSNALLEKVYTCSCHKTFTIRSEYIKHKKEEQHLYPTHHSCGICNKIFTRKCNLYKHMRRHNNERPYKCEICSASFFAKGNLKRHVMIHTGEKPHACEFCHKHFSQLEKLRDHRRTHTGEKPFLCTYCGKMYHTKQKLDKHLVLHRNKKFLCSHCGKTFYTIFALRSHVKVHTGAKPYPCTICNRKFSYQQVLQTHMLIHTGNKPYQCKICTRSFAQRAHLNAHSRTHSGEKPHVCPHCNRSFAQNGNLRVHIRTHTGETPYMCDLCPKGFYDSSSLKRHKRRHSEGSTVGERVEK